MPSNRAIDWAVNKSSIRLTTTTQYLRNAGVDGWMGANTPGTVYARVHA